MGELGQLLVPGRQDVAGSPPPIARSILERSMDLGAPVEYLGVDRYDSRIRVYQGEGRDWVLAPLQLDPLFRGQGGRLPIPRMNLERLRGLVEGGVDFPSVFIGHDIPARSALRLTNADPATGSELVPTGAVAITPEVARGLVAPVPAPARTVEWSHRYGTACDLMLKALAGVSVAAVGIAVAPLFMVAPMFAAFTDPILFGAIPLTETPTEGSPTAWFALASWEY